MAANELHMYLQPDDREIVETLTDGSLWASIAGHLTPDELTCLCILLRRAGVTDTDLAQIWEEWEQQEPDATATSSGNAIEIARAVVGSLATITTS